MGNVEIQENLKRKRTAISRFVARIVGLPTEGSETATSGLWEITITKTMVPAYHVHAKHPHRAEKMDIIGLDPEAIAWKMIGEQLRITELTWDKVREV